MQNHSLLVDLSHLIYRSVCIPQLAKMHTKKDKIPTGGIYGVLQSIYKCLEMDPTINKVYLLKDGHAKWRRDIYPDYKANRDSNPESPNYKSYIEPNAFGWSKKDTLKFTNDLLVKLANNLGIHVIFDELSEADDLAYLMGKELIANGEQLTFLTSDRDWFQLIKIFPNVRIFDGIKGEFYDKDNFNETQGYDPKWFHFHKAMLGDNSDNIQSVAKGVGDKAVLKLIELAEEQGLDPDSDSFQTDLLSLINNLDESELGRFKSIKLIDEEAIKKYDLNIKLIDFRKCPHKFTLQEQLKSEQNQKKQLNYMEVMKMFKELEFSNLGKILSPDSPFYRLV